tara:strand:+ start:6645 stop:6857 length:213 start_codon:yes stop_codon:yes gene_type:complete
MNYILKRIGLFIYGGISVLEAFANFFLYISHLDFVIKPVDWAMPFYFWYINKFLKGNYIANLRSEHGKDI